MVKIVHILIQMVIIVHLQKQAIIVEVTRLVTFDRMTPQTHQQCQETALPVVSTYWSTQSYSITTAGSTTNFSTNYMSSSVVWWYYFAYSTNAISSLTFTLTGSWYASVEVYLEKTNSNYNYVGALSSSMTVSYSSSTDKYVWLLVTPSSSNSYAYMSVYANAVSSDSSSSTSGSSSSDSNTIIIAIVCSVAGVVA